MNGMYERLDEFAKTLPEPRPGTSWDAYYGQHISNAQKMRAAAVRFALADLGRGLRAAGGRLAQGLRGVRRPGLGREQDALQH